MGSGAETEELGHLPGDACCPRSSKRWEGSSPPSEAVGRGHRAQRGQAGSHEARPAPPGAPGTPGHVLAPCSRRGRTHPPRCS